MRTYDKISCPVCGGAMRYFDKVPRVVRGKNRETRWVRINRVRCLECGHTHRELPDYIFPYAQYDSEIIKGVTEGYITCETYGYEDYPCEMTMLRWRKKYIAYCENNSEGDVSS